MLISIIAYQDIKIAESCLSTSNASDLIEMLDILNPRKIVGKVVLITRMGYKTVEDKLPGLIDAVKGSEHLPVWLCDPCHGNTISTLSKVKTRIVEQMLIELKSTHMIHAEHGTYLGGIHIEQTGEVDITECVDTLKQDLSAVGFPRYRSLCDPRLSRTQALNFTQNYVQFVKDLAMPPTVLVDGIATDKMSMTTGAKGLSKVGSAMMERSKVAI